MTVDYDIAIIGGGVMGCGAALRLAQGGMQCIVIDQGPLGQGASGVNAGTLSMQIKRIKLMPYALRGRRLWEDMGKSVGYRRTGGYTLAFNEKEATLLEERMTLKREAGADIRFVLPQSVHANEPGFSNAIVAASYCPDDGYANASLTGAFYRAALKEQGIAVCENAKVTHIEASKTGFRLLAGRAAVSARRVLFACGAWLKDAAAMIGVALPVRARVNTVSVSERAPRIFSSIVGHATGLLTLKQKENGTVLIGGGWQGRGDPTAGRGAVSSQTLVPNIQLANYTVPALSSYRIIRSWTGFEAHSPDFYPLAGALPGFENAYVLGCVRGGYTIGPFISRLMGDLILGREPEMPLFDPGRSFQQ